MYLSFYFLWPVFCLKGSYLIKLTPFLVFAGSYSLKVFTFGAIIGIVLIPINYMGSQLTDDSDFQHKSLDSFSISNVNNGSNRWILFLVLIFWYYSFMMKYNTYISEILTCRYNFDFKFLMFIFLKFMNWFHMWKYIRIIVGIV